MFKFFAGTRKEFLILIRDLPGLGILFLMPVLLIMIVSLAQKNALKSSKENKTEILFLDKSQSAFSKQVSGNLEASGLFTMITSVKGKKISEPTFTALVSKGKYPVGLLITEQDSAIRIISDPSLQPSYKNAITGSLTYLIKGTQSRIAIEVLLKRMAPGMDETINSMINSSIQHMTPVNEVFAVSDKSVIKPTLTQNTVPGFILFAMFFIVLPLSGSLISEKSEGSYQRLKTLPVTIGTILSSKVLVYLIVCTIQFLLMVFVGMWLLPAFFGIPALQLGNQYLSIIVATIAASLAAVGFGLMVGSLASTNGQASIFGSMTIVILGVLSGTFLPVYLMPDFLQYLSLASPIRWGIDNYLDIFIRETPFWSIFPNILYLLLFFVFAMTISILNFAKQK